MRNRVRADFFSAIQSKLENKQESMSIRTPQIALSLEVRL